MEEVSEKRREKKGRKVREDNGEAVIIGQFLESHTQANTHSSQDLKLSNMPGYTRT